MPTILDQGYPARYESRLTLRNGKKVFVRPILESDGHLLLDLFNDMSPQSIFQRFLRRLGALPEDMIHRFTHINYDTEFALVAVIKGQVKDAIIAVGRYAYDQDDDITDLAVAVHDDWQRLGLGKSLLVKIVAVAKDHGIFRFQSMMDLENDIMQRILSELGYDVKYSSRSGFFQVDIFV